MLKILNFLVRGLTLFGKFILFFYMAKHLTPDELGIYGLLSTLIIASIYLVGLDFYTFSTRELVKLEKKGWAFAYKSQLFLIICTYTIFLPLIVCISKFFISYEWIPILIILIFLEHLNQEFMRILIIEDKTILANNLLFIRSGLWCYVVIGLMFFSIIEYTLWNIFIAWIISGLLSFAISCFFVLSGVDFKRGSIKQEWIIRGIKTCLIFLLSTLFIRLIITFDKLWIELIYGKEQVAIYTLFFSLTSALLSFLEAGCFSFIYPKMIYYENNKKLFLNQVFKMINYTLVITAIVSFAMMWSIDFLLSWIGKDVYIQHKTVFYVLLFSNILYALSCIPHYILYTKKKDLEILRSNLISCFVFLLGVSVFLFYNIKMAIPYGLCVSFLFLFFVKLFFSYGLIKNWK